jgi:hypothetical protein
VDGKPLFLIFQPMDLSADVIAFWQRLALSAGLPGIHFTGIVKNAHEAQTAWRNGFAACTISRTSGRGTRLSWDRELVRHILGNKRAPEAYQKLFHKPFHVYDSRHTLPYINIQPPEGMDFYPCVLPGWDNTPRAGLNGQVFLNSSPEIFRQHLEEAWARVADYPPEHQIIILKSWNEWAEGNYLEPDLKFGLEYLKSIQNALETYKINQGK